MTNNLIPTLGVVTDIRVDTPDIKTFRVEKIGGGKCFEHEPGQCAMLSIPGVGEAMFSITSSPTVADHQEFSIKKCGCLTSWLHLMEPGQQIIAGGVGLAPLHSVINYCLAKRENYGKIDVVYGSRSKDDLLTIDEIQNEWMKPENDLDVHLTIDRAQEGWDGHVGFVPNYVTELGFDPNKCVLVCGPPIMIKFVLQALDGLGFQKDQIYTTLELRMKCGIGKCGRCNIGDKYVCKDGPVFRFDQLDELPNEY